MIAIAIASLILIIAGIAFFAASETSFLSISLVHLKSLERATSMGKTRIAENAQSSRNKVPGKLKGVRKARCAMRLWHKMDNLLSLVLIGTNFLDAAAASLSTAIAMQIGGSVFIAALLTTAFVTVFGEIVPKTFSLSHTDEVVLFTAPILQGMQRVFFPVIMLFSLICRAANFIACRLFPSDDSGVTEADIKMMIDVGAAEGTLKKAERDMIYKIFTLGDITVRSFMRHRSLVVSIPANADKEEARRAFAKGYSHIPVIDNNDVAGVLDYRCMLLGGDDIPGFARHNMTPPLFIPETHTASAVINRFREENADFAIVLDEQGAFSGIVTMDILCRVVFARMADDNLSPAPAPLERVRVISENECIIPGDIRIEDANDLLGTHFASDDFTTMGGWLLEQFGRLPSVGEVYVAESMAFVVEDQGQRRILSIRVKEIQQTPIAKTKMQKPSTAI